MAETQSQRSLLQILKKYEPGMRYRDILESAISHTVRADKEKRMLEISAHFPAPIDKEELYAIEEEIRVAYDLAAVRILPHYPAQLFTKAYVPNVLMETERVGIVARGFFRHYEVTLNENELHIDLPFAIDGIRLMENAHTPQVIEGIILSEFGVKIKVLIHHNLTLQTGASSYSMERRLEAIDQQIARAESEYDRMMENRRAGDDFAEAAAADADEPAVLPRTPSIYFDTIPLPEKVSDDQWHIGHATYDVANPEVLVGQLFDITPVTLASLTHPQKGIVILGSKEADP